MSDWSERYKKGKEGKVRDARTSFTESVKITPGYEDKITPEQAFDGLQDDLKGFAEELTRLFPDGKMFTSGKRVLGQAGTSEHSKHLTGEALDLTNREDVKHFLTGTVEGTLLLKKYGLGVLDETDPETLKRTRGDAPHLHIGTDYHKRTDERYNRLMEDPKVATYVKNLEKSFIEEGSNFSDMLIGERVFSKDDFTPYDYSGTTPLTQVEGGGGSTSKSESKSGQTPDTNEEQITYDYSNQDIHSHNNPHLARINQTIEEIKAEQQKTKEEKELQKKEEAYLKKQQEEIQKRQMVMQQAIAQDQRNIEEQRGAMAQPQQQQQRPRVQLTNTQLPPLPKFITQLPQQKYGGEIDKFPNGGTKENPVDMWNRAMAMAKKEQPLKARTIQPIKRVNYYDPLQQVEVSDRPVYQNQANIRDAQVVELAEQIKRNDPSVSSEQALQTAYTNVYKIDNYVQPTISNPSAASLAPGNEEFSERVLDDSFSTADVMKAPLDILATGWVADDETRQQRRFNRYNPGLSTAERFSNTAQEALGLGTQAGLNLALTRGMLPQGTSALRTVAESVSPYVPSRAGVNSLGKWVNSTKNLSKTLDEFTGELLQGRSNKRAIKEGNEWLRNWINHPRTQKKIDYYLDKSFEASKRKDLDHLMKKYRESTSPLTKEILLEQIEKVKRREFDKSLELIRDQSKSFVPSTKEYPLLNQVRDIIISEPHIHRGNLGVSYRHSEPLGYIEEVAQGVQAPYDRFGSWVSRSSNIPQSKRASTTVHEGTHDWVTEEALEKSGMKSFLLDNMNPKLKEDFTRWEMYRKLGVDPSKEMGKGKAYLSYLADPTEQYARVMELRKALNLSPSHRVDENYAQKVINWVSKGESPIDPTFLKVIDNDPKKLANLFNKLWVVTPAAIGTAAMSQDYQQGGTHQKRRPLPPLPLP